MKNGKEFLFKNLYEKVEINSDELTNLYFIQFPDEIENREKLYTTKGVKKNLRSQLRSELSVIIIEGEKLNLIKIIKSKWNKKYKYAHLFLTDEGKKYYEDNYLNKQ